MDGYSLITYTIFLSIFVWLFPPIKQYKTKYFLFFIIMAGAGTGATVLGKLTGTKANTFYPAIYLFLLYALSVHKHRQFILAAAVVSIMVFLVIKPGDTWLMGIPMVINIAMLIIVLSRIVADLTERQELNLFKTLLFVYIAIDTVKLFDYAVMVTPGYRYYMLGVAAQIPFGIAFCFVNVNTKIFKLRVRELS